MDTVIASKHLIIEQINSIIGFVQEDNKVKSNEIENLYSKIKKLNSDNKTLHNELMEKEKQIAISEKKMIDYEVMINHIQDKANEEIEEKEKFSMLRAKDKEIHQLNMIVQKMETEITHLKKMNESSQSKCDKNIEMDIKSKSVCGFSPTSSPSPVYTKPESLDLNEETPVEETQVEETPVEETPVEETQVEETPVEETPVEETPIEEIPCGRDSSGRDPVEETSVEETPVEETPVEEESDDDDGIEVQIVTHYKKEYYIIVGETPQYIYAIDDGDLGEKVGEMKKNKKEFYNPPSRK